MPHAHLRGVVIHDLWPFGGKDVLELRSADVDLVEGRLRRNVGAVACRQVVDHDDVVAVFQVRFDDMRADETGTAGDQDLHEDLREGLQRDQ
jgi:hypothetical protein